MGDHRKITKQLRREHKKQLPEVNEDNLNDEGAMGRAKSDAAGSSKESKEARKKKPTRERWLLTRKTWRYMADAGRRLIPEGVQNRPEDIPKIESYFQHVCNKEPRFLLWRKSSYPGALGFRSHYRKNRNRKKGGSYREKASSADEAEEYIRMDKVTTGARESAGGMVMTQTTSGRFDVQRLRQEFLQGPLTSTPSTSSTGVERQEKPERPKSFIQKFARISKPPTRSPDIEEDVPFTTNFGLNTPPPGSLNLDRSRSSIRQEPEVRTPDELEELDQQEFIETLTRYLKQAEEENDFDGNTVKDNRNNSSDDTEKDIDFQKLLDQLRKNLASEFSSQRLQERSSSERHHQGGIISTRSNVTPSVHFEGDYQQKMLLETLNRYFGKTTNRQKVISDLLTDRKLLEKLYFDLRRTRGFRGRSSGNGGSTFVPQYRLSGTGGFDRRRAGGDDGERDVDEVEEPSSWKRLGKTAKSFREGHFSPPPLIEVQHENEPVFDDEGTQTAPISPTMMVAIEDELRKIRDKAREDNEGIMSPGGTHRRRSSVDHDDVSPSVSDTIKRYLRMARKKSLDSDKVDRFKRVNYDRNLRNIKPKGEITKPGDDDGLNKGAQTDETWIDAIKELKLDDIIETSDVEVSGGNEEFSGSRITSSRSSVDIEDGLLSPLSPTSPTHHKGILSSGQSFLSSLLHGLQHHQATQGGTGAVAGSGSSAGALSGHPAAAGAMQKSKSSSSVVQHGRSLVAKKIWRSRSKSQTRAAAAVPCTWTPQGHCVWSNVGGQQVTLSETTLLDLSEVERRVLQKVAVDKLQALNLGVNVKVPSDSVGAVAHKPKRRAYLLKRKALTTGFFDTARGKDGDKDKDGGTPGGFVFGISIGQCLENDRLARRSRSDGSFQGRPEDDPNELRRQSHHGSRSSFSSLIETARAEESGSCESLMSPPERMAGSVPGLLDALSCGSTLDIAIGDREPGIPQLVKSSLKHLEAFGLHTLGIFRVSSSKKRVRQLREEFDCGKEILLTQDHCPHDVATLLKEFFRDLPEPLLCRDLYHAFLQTQKIRNRRLQYEALQHLAQLLPAPNRDTLWALLNFLNVVAQNSSDHRDKSGEWVEGNKMDSNNLATLFAPNILHCIKPGCGKELSSERAEERIDVINVIRSMIDHNKDLFQVSAELLDEVYVHMMDSHPEALDLLLRKRNAGGDELDDQEGSTLDGGTSESSCRTLDQEPSGERGDGEDSQVRRVWSREEFLHETAGMGGPDMAMRPRHKDRDRGRERSSKKRSGNQDDSSNRRAADDGAEATKLSLASVPSKHSEKTLSQYQDTNASQKTRSVSVDSGHVTSADEFTSTAIMFKVMDDQERRQSSPVMTGTSGVITASLKIPVPGAAGQPFALNLDDVDIPYIEDGTGYTTTEGGRQQMTIGLVRGTAISTRSRRQRSASGSDSSQTSTVLPVTGSMALVQGYDSAMGSSATFSSPPRNTTPSVCSSSGGEAGPFSSTPSWASTPPTSPDATVTTVNYIPDDPRFAMPIKGTSGEDLTTQTARFSIPAKGSMTYQRGTSVTTKEIAPVMLQKVTFTSTSELQQVQRGDAKSSYVSYHKSYSPGSSGELPKSASTSAVVVNKKVEFEPERVDERDRKLTTSISSIGGAVMRCKTADIERMLKLQKDVPKPKTTPDSPDDKKKYAKRRYTDSRHQTRHIPDAESLQAAAKTTVSSGETTEVATRTAVRKGTQPGPVWKRRELIASDPKEHETFL